MPQHTPNRRPNTKFELVEGSQVLLNNIPIIEVVVVDTPPLKIGVRCTAPNRGGEVLLFDHNQENYRKMDEDFMVVGVGDNFLIGDVECFMSGFTRHAGKARIYMKSSNEARYQQIRRAGGH